MKSTKQTKTAQELVNEAQKTYSLSTKQLITQQ